jgi:ABC-type uncharacterized transport system involved in gliding motility auxiliary subunit
MVEKLVPFAVMVEGDAVINEVDAVATPGIKFTTALSVIALPEIVPVMVDDPVLVPEVKMAV